MENPQIEIILDSVVLPHHNFLKNLINEEKQRQETLAKIAARYEYSSSSPSSSDEFWRVMHILGVEDCLIGRTADEIREMALEWYKLDKLYGSVV